jgi:hypothetical protein
MTTPRKAESNRKNAMKSTGPKTGKGKARSSMNALKHGLTASLTPIKGLEDGEAWNAHREQIISEMDPHTFLEAHLADRVAILLWRLGRVVAAESAAAENRGGIIGNDDDLWLKDGERLLPKWDVLENINRCEAHLHRTLMQTLHELQRIQAARGDSGLPSVAAIDVIAEAS